ncbi:hypothetical protein [uncultured Roseobacter sp.]|uniref:hypothetical protein n=2 Tax=uncultured Roseobacter sp. TaxID=114847 RepID=UPI00261870B0|nr:hypothetical protein [uncultured Roseobacter sp.]
MIREIDLETFSLKAHFAKHAQDFDDLQNEMAGRDVGRIERFLNADIREDKISGKRGTRKEAGLTNLQILMMNNPAYAALFEETVQVLSDAQRELDDLLQRVQAEIKQANAALDDKLDCAAKLPDGTNVFKDQNGDIRTEDGTLVAPELAATILWRGDEPTLETVNAAKERLNRLTDLANDVRAGQAEIGGMQSGMADETEPPSADDLNGFKKRAEEITHGTEQRFEQEMTRSAPTVTKTAVEATSDLVVPKL